MNLMNYLIAPFLCVGFLPQVTDFGKITQISVHQVIAPKSIEELQNLVRYIEGPMYGGPISVAGARGSMGGQTMVRRGTVIDMCHLNKMVKLNAPLKRITVQAGATWKDVQRWIDPYNLSVKVMQSYCDFTVGGSLGVNAHGRYLGYGSLIETVRSFKILLADGSIVKASRTENPDLFKAALGGYGLLGIIVEVTLDLTDNVKIENRKICMPIEDYFTYLSDVILKDPHAVLHNADFYPPNFTHVISTTWYTSDKSLTITDRLQNYQAQSGSSKKGKVVRREVKRQWYDQNGVPYNQDREFIDDNFKLFFAPLPEGVSIGFLREDGSYNYPDDGLGYDLQPPTFEDDRRPSVGSGLGMFLGLAAIRRFDGAKILREKLDVMNVGDTTVCWRNYEAGYTINQLRLPETFSSTLLQEFFIPIPLCQEFVQKMRVVLKDHQVNVINLSIRHVKANSESLLAWSPQECCAFVLYYEQPKNKKALDHAVAWSRELIDAALACKGTYYLPYQLYGSDAQFKAAYPRYKEFETIKRLYDPNLKFQNCFWQTYF